MVESLCIISLDILLQRLAFTKCCWHFYLLVRFQRSIDNWTKTQWRQINVEQMDVELRRFAKASSITVCDDDLSSSAPPSSIFPDLVSAVLDRMSLFTSNRMIWDRIFFFFSLSASCTCNQAYLSVNEWIKANENVDVKALSVGAQCWPARNLVMGSSL